ncbi:metallophosphoesterase family protein [Rarobacter incanus]|uniref:Nuclease SbcCD subunit D n=1 Tax=Rarobacter incanus TaxID=153494 RepID=A0A542SPT1_9MICO|nr:metallophosphoesterase [Rarobacter incanus]TQK76626.1 DNA repair exonuclease SbcCD nuclease subunit [Rarobacter incanus]
MRFIATADWQLGMTARYLSDEARPRYHQARLDAVRRIGELARDRDAAFVVVGGDVFEHNQLDRAIVSRAFEALRGFTVPVVLVPGNHDPLDAGSIYRSPAFTSACPANVIVATGPRPFSVVPGASIVAAPWSSKRPTSDLVADALAPLEPRPDGQVRVLVGHGAVASLNPDASSLAAIDDTALAAAADSGVIDFAVLGDRHSTTQVAPRIWYPGTPEVTARREVEPGNVLVVDVDPASRSADVEVVRVGTWRFVTLQRTLAEVGDVDQLGRDLDAMPAKERTGVWLALTGALTAAAAAQLESVIDRARDVFARLDVWDSHSDLAVIPDDHDFTDMGLSGFADDAVRELAALALSDSELARTAQDALSVLYRIEQAQS